MVSSTIRLDELDLATDTHVTLTMIRGEVTAPATWHRSWQARDGAITHRVARQDGGHIIELANHITCAVNEALDQIVVDSEHADADLARPLVHHVLPLVFAHRGALVLHASAVAIDGAAVALFGRSTAGKSTMAAALTRDGATLLSDDGLWIDDSANGAPTCRGTYRGVWLARASCDALGLPYAPPQPGGKSLALRDHATSEPLPLRAIIWLDESDTDQDVAIETRRMTAADLYFALYDHLFQLDPADRTRARSVFERLTDLATTVPAWRLEAPYEFDQIAGACALVQGIARQTSPGGDAP